MSRQFVRLISLMFILNLPAAAEEVSPTKQSINKLYAEYKKDLKAGKAEHAYSVAQEMYDLTLNVYGQNSKSHSTAAFNLSQMASYNGDHKKSVVFLQEHIDILLFIKAPKDKKLTYKYSMLSKKYSKVNDVKNALKYAKKSLKIAEDINLSQQYIASLELRLGSYYTRQGKRQKAEKYLNGSLEKLETIYGTGHIETALPLFLIAKSDMINRKFKRSSKKFENVLSIYEENLEKGHDNILQTHAFLVEIYDKIGDDANSTKHCIAVAKERPLDADMEWTPLLRIHPTYPPSALYAGKSGNVVFEFTVNDIGQVANIKTIEGKNIKTFKKAAITALKRFRYAPSIKNGKRVSVEGVKIKIGFNIER